MATCKIKSQHAQAHLESRVRAAGVNLSYFTRDNLRKRQGIIEYHLWVCFSRKLGECSICHKIVYEISFVVRYLYCALFQPQIPVVLLLSLGHALHIRSICRVNIVLSVLQISLSLCILSL